MSDVQHVLIKHLLTYQLSLLLSPHFNHAPFLSPSPLPRNIPALYGGQMMVVRVRWTQTWSQVLLLTGWVWEEGEAQFLIRWGEVPPTTWAVMGT